MQHEAALCHIALTVIQHVSRRLDLAVQIALYGGKQLAGLCAGQLHGIAAQLVIVEPAAGDILHGDIGIDAEVVVHQRLAHHRHVVHPVHLLIQRRIAPNDLGKAATDKTAVLHLIAELDGLLIHIGTAAAHLFSCLIHFVLGRLALGQHRLMKGNHLRDGFLVRQVIHIPHLVIAAEADALHLVGVGDIAADAEGIEPHRKADDHQRHGQRRRADPAPAGEHPEGLVQQHLDAEIDDQAADDLVDQQSGQALGGADHVP